MATDPVNPEHWLDEREQRAWRAFLGVHAQLTARLQRQLQRDSGLSYADYEVLVRLSEASEGRLRAFQLGDGLRWEKSRLSHQLSRMQGRGLVDRQECPTDRRGAFVVLTDAGRAAIQEAAPRHAAEVRRAFVDALDPDSIDALGDLMDRVSRHLAQVDADHSKGPEPD
jgi:DNA-binding MarR family transcriptional regulator